MHETVLAIELQWSPPCMCTFSATNLTTLVSSWTTRSTHLMLGSFSLEICFLTMASKAMSGVNKPTRMPDQ